MSERPNIFDRTGEERVFLDILLEDVLRSTINASRTSETIEDSSKFVLPPYPLSRNGRYIIFSSRDVINGGEGPVNRLNVAAIWRAENLKNLFPDLELGLISSNYDDVIAYVFLIPTDSTVFEVKQLVTQHISEIARPLEYRF
jgi:hypothetical protein